MTISIPFQLGAYLNSPDGSNPANELHFETNYTSFSSLMGVAPSYLDYFTDYTQPVADWTSNASWEAWSASLSPDAQQATPAVALALASTAPGSATPDQQFQAFAAGDYDSEIKGVVQSWVTNGFKNLIFRLGWEMNLSGPNYAGDTAQDQADWVTAYQHVYTVLHQEATALGINLQVMWNPGTTNYSNAEATTNLYPGNNYVDIIGADVYADMQPYSDTTSGAPEYHDWSTSGEDTSVAQFIANPVNREHYWTYPAATEWSLDSSGGHSQSLASLIQFAEQKGKPFAIPETGAGNSSSGGDVTDDPTFPQWLAAQLTAAQNAGEKIDFVNLWDSWNYEFSNSSDNKPLEAAAWAKYFGAQTMSTTTILTPASGGSITDGAGNVWILTSAGIIDENGTAVPGGSGIDAFTILTGQDYGQNATTKGWYTYANGTWTSAPAPPGATVPITTPDTLTLRISEDAWMGDAEFTVSVDGKQLGGTLTASALHSTGDSAVFALTGSWGSGVHDVQITFINDAYGGSPSVDRNLYVNSIGYDGVTYNNTAAALMGNGSKTFAVGGTTAAGTAPADTLTLHLSEDAYNGNAQFTLSIDGKTISRPQNVTALHSAGAWQDLSFAGNLGAGTHTVGVNFTNDAYGGTATTDRNLYVNGIDCNNTHYSSGVTALMSNGTAVFTITTSH